MTGDARPGAGGAGDVAGAAAAGPRPTAGVARLAAYHVPRSPTPVDLRLDGNEGMVPSTDLIAGIVGREPELLRLYPDKRPLEARLAERLGVAADQVLVTAGADDALDRVMRAFLGEGRHLLLPAPTFEMLEIYPTVLGSPVVHVPWRDGPYPTEAVLERLGPETGVVALVTPNNPTGAVATAEDLARIAAAAPHAVVLVDHAYVEYGGDDLTRAVDEHPHVVVTRSLSKAYGLAGLRLGYAVARPEVVALLAAAGNPYPVSGPSIALALDQLARPDEEFEGHVARVREERDALDGLLRVVGMRPQPSRANFVLARCDDPLWWRDALAGMGVGVRAFPGRPDLEDALRVTCPGDPDDFTRLEHALRTVHAPEAVLFDMDGVLADVSGSYREAVRGTARSFGVELSAEDVTAAKARGDANNDWVLTRRLLAERGVEADLGAVTARFEALYQGEPGGAPGLRETEALLIPREALAALARRRPCAVVTGRPRADMEHFLDRHGLTDLFAATVCMDEAPAKPDPGAVLLALGRLGVRRAWMLGDTPDDVRAARAAGVLPLGVAAPGDAGAAMTHALLRAGAGRVLDRPADLPELVP